MNRQLVKVPFVAEIQANVTDLLKREVVLMREILSNMLEEESAFIEKDPKALQDVMIKRDAPLQALMKVREERSEKIREFLHLLDPQEKSVSTKNLISLMDAKGLESCEVSVLQDQLIALIEKMNIQHSSNDNLMMQTSLMWKDMMAGILTPDYSMISPLSQPEKRKAPVLGVMNRE